MKLIESSQRNSWIEARSTWLDTCLFGKKFSPLTTRFFILRAGSFFHSAR